MKQIKQINNKFNWEKNYGTRVVVTAFGLLCGLTGIISGLFEIHQGNMPPVIIIPNFLLTGILAIIISCFVIIWSVGFIHKKYGATIFLGFSVVQMFVVGGELVIDLAIITSILATRIDKPLNWWRSHLPTNLRFWLVKLLPFSLICYAIIASTMFVLSILKVNDEVLMKSIVIVLAAAMFIPILLMIFGGIAHDIQRQINVDQEPKTV